MRYISAQKLIYTVTSLLLSFCIAVSATAADSLDKFYRSASTLLDAKQYEMALEMTQRALKIDPNHVRSQWYQGLALVGLERFGDAYVVLKTVSDTNPNNKKMAAFAEKTRKLAKKHGQLKRISPTPIKTAGSKKTPRKVMPLSQSGGSQQSDHSIDDNMSAALTGGPLYIGNELSYANGLEDYFTAKKARTKKVFGAMQHTALKTRILIKEIVALSSEWSVLTAALAERIKDPDENHFSLASWRYLKDYVYYFLGEKPDKADQPVKEIFTAVASLIKKNPKKFSHAKAEKDRIVGGLSSIAHSLELLDSLNPKTPELHSFHQAQKAMLEATRESGEQVVNALRKNDRVALQKAVLAVAVLINEREKFVEKQMVALRKRTMDIRAALESRYEKMPNNKVTRHYRDLEKIDDLPTMLLSQAAGAMDRIAGLQGLWSANGMMLKKTRFAPLTSPPASAMVYDRFTGVETALQGAGKELEALVAEIGYLASLRESAPELFNGHEQRVDRILQQLDRRLGRAVTQYNEAFLKWVAVNEGLDSLKQADFLMLRQFIQDLERGLPKLEANIVAMERNGIDSEVIQTARASARFYTDLLTDLRNMDGDRFAQKEHFNWLAFFIREAHAEGPSWGTRALNTLSTPLKALSNAATAGAKTAWKGVKGLVDICRGKTLVGKYPCHPRNAASTMAARAGIFATEVLGTAKDILLEDLTVTKSNGKQSVTYQRSLLEKISDVVEKRSAERVKHVRDLYQNYREGWGGTEWVKSGVKNLEAIDDNLGKAASYVVNKTWGKGMVSDTAGGVVRLASGMFTDLFKGVGRLADTKATAGETALGVFEVATSAGGVFNMMSKVGTALKSVPKHGYRVAKSGFELIKRKWAVSSTKGLTLNNKNLVKQAVQIAKGGEKEMARAILKNAKNTRTKNNILKKLSQLDFQETVLMAKETFKQDTKKVIDKTLLETAGWLGKEGSLVDGITKNLLNGRLTQALKQTSSRLLQVITGPGETVVAKTLGTVKNLAEEATEDVIKKNIWGERQSQSLGKTRVEKNAEGTDAKTIKSLPKVALEEYGKEIERAEKARIAKIRKIKNAQERHKAAQRRAQRKAREQMGAKIVGAILKGFAQSSTDRRHKSASGCCPKKKIRTSSSKPRSRGCMSQGKKGQFRGMYSPCVSLCRYYQQGGLKNPVLQNPTRKRMLLSSCIR